MCSDKWKADYLSARERESARARERERARARARTRRENTRKRETRVRERERERERESARARAMERERGRAREGPRKMKRGRAAPARQRQRWGLLGLGLERRLDIAGLERIDTVGVPARLWSGEGRRGGAPTSAGTDRRGTGQWARRAYTPVWEEFGGLERHYGQWG